MEPTFLILTWHWLHETINIYKYMYNLQQSLLPHQSLMMETLSLLNTVEIHFMFMWLLPKKNWLQLLTWQLQVFKNTVKQKVLNLITYMSYLTCITVIKLDYPCNRKIKHTLLLENLYGRLPNIFSRMWSVCRQHKIQYNMIGSMCIT